MKESEKFTNIRNGVFTTVERWEVLDKDTYVAMEDESGNQLAMVPRNDYAAPTEVRAEVVDAVCRAFLAYHEFMAMAVDSTAWDMKINRVFIDDKFASFGRDGRFCDDDNATAVRVRGAEMEAAFRMLIEAGYHMWRKGDTYKCTRKPMTQEGWIEVGGFGSFID